MTLQNKVLERIKMKGLRPTPKGFFKARDLILWVLLGAFIAALSIGFGMIIFMVKATDFELFEKLGLSASERFLYAIPYFWIAATIAIGAVAYMNYRNTRRGYRTSARQFGLYALLIAVALGSIVYALNITRYVNKAASNFVLYNAVTPLNTSTWLDPEHGLLSGVVRNRESNEDFELLDANGVLWRVTSSSVSMPEGFEFHSDDRIKIIGSIKGVDEFRAVEIRPWEEQRERVTAGEAEAIGL